jgi:hypothetical protein
MSISTFKDVSLDGTLTTTGYKIPELWGPETVGHVIFSVPGSDEWLISHFRYVYVPPQLYIEGRFISKRQELHPGAFGINIFFSDKRLKDDIKPTIVDDACSYIKRMNFVSFNWKKDRSFTELGIIAQELEEIHPSFVFTLSDTTSYGDGIGSKNVNTNTLLTYGLKATQELTERVEALEEENKKLRSELDEIKKFLKMAR